MLVSYPCNGYYIYDSLYLFYNIVVNYLTLWLTTVLSLVLYNWNKIHIYIQHSWQDLALHNFPACLEQSLKNVFLDLG